MNQHELLPKQPEPGGRWHPEEWQALAHETIWPQLAARPWIWCKFIWVMFDFGSDTRNEGDRPGINDKGLVTGDHQTKKDAYYYYQTQWTSKPMVYLTSKRSPMGFAGPTQIKAYSNCPVVRLTLNGEDLGPMNQTSPHVFIMNVSLNAGTNVASVIGFVGDSQAASDQWNGSVIPSLQGR